MRGDSGSREEEGNRVKDGQVDLGGRERERVPRYETER